MADSKELSKNITTGGLYRLGYEYRPRLIDWLGAVFNPLTRKKIRFDITCGSRFSFCTVDYPAPSLFQLYEKRKTILVDLKPGDNLKLKLSGEWRMEKFSFIVDDPGTFRE